MSTNPQNLLNELVVTNDKYLAISGTLRIVYDRVIFRRQLYGGISEFWRRLTNAMGHVQALQCEWEQEVAFPMFRPNRTPHIIFHSSYYRHSTGRGSKTVTTLHDFIQERGLASGIALCKARVLSHLKYRTLKKSSIIVCVSNAALDDLKEIYPDIASRTPVHVIHHGPTLDRVADYANVLLSEPGFPKKLLESPYFLFVGLRGGYKNFALLLQAFHRSPTRRNGLRLFVVGNKFSAGELSLMTKLDLHKSVINVGHVSNSILSLLYQKAVALVYPSACEGFGLPILDAMYLGCPVVAASIPPVLEVAHTAVELFESNSVESLMCALDSVLSSERRSALRNAGFRRCPHFSWDTAVQKYLAAYQLAARL